MKSVTGKKQRQSVTPDWHSIHAIEINGVMVKEVAHVPLNNGYVTEFVRTEWLSSNTRIDQVFQRVLDPGALSAWHRHAKTTDRLFCAVGRILVVLYDGRTGSSTFGRLSEYRIGTLRPTLIVVPPGVWHGVKNLGAEAAVVINMVDRPYDYFDPDHWMIPADEKSPIPYQFP